MFGRFKENEDEPGWREKLADWRDAPPIILERPGWLAESPASLALLFGGIALLMVSFVYFIVPADALPAEIPGRWVAPSTTVAKATSSTSTTTTTTTPPALMRARLKDWSKDSDEKKAERWRWIKAVQEFRAAEAEAEAILREPPKPPYRRWAYGFLAGCVAVGMIVAAWVTSDARSRRQWQS